MYICRGGRRASPAQGDSLARPAGPRGGQEPGGGDLTSIPMYVCMYIYIYIYIYVYPLAAASRLLVLPPSSRDARGGARVNWHWGPEEPRSVAERLGSRTRDFWLEHLCAQPRLSSSRPLANRDALRTPISC